MFKQWRTKLLTLSVEESMKLNKQMNKAARTTRCFIYRIDRRVLPSHLISSPFHGTETPECFFPLHSSESSFFPRTLHSHFFLILKFLNNLIFFLFMCIKKKKKIGQTFMLILTNWQYVSFINWCHLKSCYFIIFLVLTYWHRNSTWTNKLH